MTRPAPWPALQKAVGLRRAPWVAEALRPTNLTDRPAGGPQFREPDAPARLPSMARTLPDRFLVRIEQDGAEPVTVHTPADPRRAAGRAGRRRPAGDAEARRRGPAADGRVAALAGRLRPGGRSRHGGHRAAPGARSERRTGARLRRARGPVRGPTVRPGWTGLLRSHRFTDGAEFLPQGTPTNNTDTVRPEWSRRTPLGPPSLDGRDRPAGRGQRCGDRRRPRLDPALVATLPSAEDSEQGRARAFNTALWATTWGDAIEHPHPAGRAERRQAARHAVARRRPRPLDRSRPRPRPAAGDPARPAAVRAAADRRDRPVVPAAPRRLRRDPARAVAARPPAGCGRTRSARCRR